MTEKIRAGPGLDIEAEEEEIEEILHEEVEVSEGKARLMIKNDMRMSETIMQPDILMVSEFWNRMKARHSQSPERALMVAVLEDATTNFQKYINAADTKGKTNFWEAKEWFESDDEVWFFSFINVCEFLGLDSNYLRKGIFKWEREHKDGLGKKDLTGRDHRRLGNQ